MKHFRHALRRHRWLVLLVTAATSFYAAEGQLWAEVAQVERAEAERLLMLAQRLGVPPERLERQSPGLLAAFRSLRESPDELARRVGEARLEARLDQMAQEVAANPFRPRIDEVLKGYAHTRAEAVLAVLAQVSTVDVVGLSREARRALLRNLRADLEEALELPEREGLPGAARGRANALRGRLQALVAKLRPILNRPGALDDDRLSRTLAEIASAVDGEVRRPGRSRAPVDRPLPIEERSREVATAPVSDATVGKASPALVAGPRTAGVTPRAGEVAPEVAALAARLGGSPARIFSWVHDRVRLDPKWGAVRGPAGTLLEGEGTSWDQAWLLRDLLAASGVDARIEWGEIEVPVELLTNLVGVSDPFRAAGLLTTGGVPIVLLVEGSRPVKARMSHPWVLAHVDYVPNRGATPGEPDAWIRIDPSLKRHLYAPGLTVHEAVPFELGAYLTSGTPLSPRRAYEDALWDYIRTNGIQCSTLEQLKRSGSVVEESFPYLPGTLRGRILAVQGESAEVPGAFQHRVRLEVRDGSGGVLLSHEVPWASVYGERVELAWTGATPDDEATIAAHGGLFETPPYLVDVAPAVRVAGVEAARGAGVGAAEAAQVRVILTEASGYETVRTHDTLAGEHHVLGVDFGAVPREVLDRHQEALTASLAAGDAATAAAEELYLLSAQYLHELGRDLGDLAGWKHQRLLRLGTEMLVSQTASVGATVGGTPVSWSRAERTVDVAGMTLGLFHADAEPAYRRATLELLGSQGSFLEDQVFPQVLERRGIAAVTALAESVRRGQAVTRVDAGNAPVVLDQVDLGTDVESAVHHAVSQGRIAYVAESRITVGQWTGTGYVLEDPETGAAGYLISGGLGGGSETGEGLEELQDLLGSESWLEGSLLGELLRQLLSLLGGGGDGGGDGPSTQQSDPINLSTGNLWRTETDLTIHARGLPVLWSRTYNSRSEHEGAFGFGWTFSYGESVEERPDGSVLYREADGTEHLFRPDGAGGFAAPPGKHLEVNPSATGFDLRTKEGLVSEFAPDGRLLALEEPNGHRITLGYDAGGRLASVTDAAGRMVLTVTSDPAGRITRVEDLAGRAVVYGYTGNDLTSVTDAAGGTWTYAYDAGHNLVGLTDPLGNTDTFSHDAHDRCYRHVDPTGATETFSYGERGRRGVVTDRRGFDTYVEFDERGRATLQADPLGNASRSTWDQGNNRTSTTDPRGGLTAREYDERGNLLAETDPLGQTTTYTYEPTYNQVVTTTDPAGHTTTNSYDGAGNLLETTQVVDGETIAESFAYDGDGLLQSRTDPRGETTTFTWDAAKGSLASQTDAAGNTTTMTTDSLGRVTAIEDPAGNPMSVTWDGKDRIVAATDPFGNTTEVAYDAAGRQTEITTPRGTSTTTYDAAGRPVASTDPLGNTTRTEYDAAGNPVVQVDAMGNRTAATYDPTGRVAARVDALGAVWSFGYCAEIGGGGGCGTGGCGGAPSGGDFCELTDPLGNTTVQDFDELGRVNRVTDPEGNVATVEYDALGRRSAVTDALGRTTRYEHDALGRLTAVVEADGARTEYTYDGTGSLTQILDAEGRTWTRTYDALGRLASEVDPLGNTTGYAYDALGNLVTRTNPDGETVTYEYDARRLTAVVLPDGARETFGYDALGRRTSVANAEVSLSFVYDALNRMTSATNHTVGQAIAYGYDANGNRTSMDGPLGRVRYLYDAKNRLVEQQDPASGTYRLQYDQADRRVGVAYPNGVTTEYEYDRASRLTLLLTRDPQQNVLDGYRYTYSPVGNRTSMRSLRNDVLHEYTYDPVDRLTRWQRGADRFEAYTYDQVGNRQQLEDERGTVTYAYDPANRLTEELRQLSGGGETTTTYTWDPNGNLLEEAVSTGSVTTYTWDALNRLAALDGPTGTHSYGYDPNGIRVRETNGADTTRFLHAGEDIVATYQAGTLDTYFTHGPGIDEPWAQAKPSATEDPLAYLHRDGLGSVTAISNPQAQLHGTTTYAAFGSVEESTGLQSRYGYTSRELDPTGSMYYRARYYQPEVGRFTSLDPVQGESQLPASLHRFTYVQNRPTAFADPSGRVPEAPGSPQLVGSGGELGLLIFLAPYLFILALLAKIALRTLSLVALKYFVAIYSWIAVISLFVSDYLIGARAAFAGQVASFAAHVRNLAIFGMALFFLGFSHVLRFVVWVSDAGSFLAFSIFLYWGCTKQGPAGGIMDVFFSREVLICAAVFFYVWAVVNLPKAPPKDL